MEQRNKVSVLKKSTIGNCTMSLTLDTPHKSVLGKYHLCLRFSMNSKRYFIGLVKNILLLNLRLSVKLMVADVAVM